MTFDDDWWKTKLDWRDFNGMYPLMEDNIWWKTIIDGKWPLKKEDSFQWKATFHETWPSIEDDPQLKMSLDGGQPEMEDDLWW